VKERDTGMLQLLSMPIPESYILHSASSHHPPPHVHAQDPEEPAYVTQSRDSSTNQIVSCNPRGIDVS
jgi:hypothetical protein